MTPPSAGFTITNRAYVYDDYGTELELTAVTLVPLYELRFPIVYRDFPPRKYWGP